MILHNVALCLYSLAVRAFPSAHREKYAEGALKEAFQLKERLVFMDFITDQTENVFPMVPGGKGLSEMILV